MKENVIIWKGKELENPNATLIVFPDIDGEAYWKVPDSTIYCLYTERNENKCISYQEELWIEREKLTLMGVFSGEGE